MGVYVISYNLKDGKLKRYEAVLDALSRSPLPMMSGTIVMFLIQSHWSSRTTRLKN